MPFYSIVFGSLLVALGLQGYFDFNGWLGVTTLHAPTALIPAGFGAALIALGLLSLAAPGGRKHFMHFAALVGLLGAAGGAYKPGKAAAAGDFDWASIPTRLQVTMAVLCVLFVLLCINSFVQARKRRALGN
ncbi:MAG: hypothetical protein U0746_14565 [Gemmataceae bacterium]